MGFFCCFRGEKSFLKSKHPNSQTEEDSHANSASETPNLEVIGKSARMLMGGQDQIKKVEDANPSATEESTYRVCLNLN